MDAGDLHRAEYCWKPGWPAKYERYEWLLLTEGQLTRKLSVVMPRRIGGQRRFQPDSVSRCDDRETDPENISNEAVSGKFWLREEWKRVASFWGKDVLNWWVSLLKEASSGGLAWDLPPEGSG